MRKREMIPLTHYFTQNHVRCDYFGPRSVHGVWNATLTTHRVPSNCPLADALGVHHAPRGWRSFIAARRRCYVPVVQRRPACFSSRGATRWRVSTGVRQSRARLPRASNGCVGLLAVRDDSSCWRMHERRGVAAQLTAQLHNRRSRRRPEGATA